ncbi:hypothetical protein SLA2020_239370 [Shorea laevis]
MAGTLLLLFISLSVTTSLFNNALANDSPPTGLSTNDPSQVSTSQDSHKDNCLPIQCRESGKATFLIVFGDSLFDVGFGVEELCLPSNYTPYGQKLNKFGRFSDGRTIPDFIAEYVFGAEERLVKPYSCNLTKTERQFKENNRTLSFARAGAGVLDGLPRETDKNTGRTLEEQVELFVKLNDTIKLFGEDSKRKEETLYLISIGAFDYLREIANKTQNGIDPTEVVNKIVDAVTNIAAKGGRRFAFMNIGPLRHYPIVQKLNLDEKTLGELDRLVKRHNKELKAKLPKTLKDSNYSYSILDYHSIIKNIMENPDSYGFDRHTIKSACCGWGPFKAYGCGSSDKVGCGEHSIEDYMFFDEMHHTEHINHLLAKIFWNSNGLASPKNLKSIAGLEKIEFDFPGF